MGLILAINSW
uniref:Uncharacterized protein n=1 Tax=Anguilla anguilla TaxID=7936 RepID=A0A0E9XDB1_ANGAN